MMFGRRLFLALLVPVLFLASAQVMFGQLDQGTITGVVQDPTGAVIANATVTLTNVDEGQVMKAKTDGAGVFTFPPTKIGNYKATAAAPNFETTTQTNLHLNIQQRLNIVITLKAGATTTTVTVTTEAPLMQTQESSIGQTMDTATISSVPLNGRNWVYIAQLSAGTTVADGSRGAGKGDFEANGQRAEENNFILDGVDNNANVVDFYNGASYVVNPPPDALAEFKVQTSDYSAEFGHSAGAVVNASIKSGTNEIHGSAWEYVRNTIFDVPSWSDFSKTTPGYHDNQFGATLGGPVLKNKVFLFADAQATRVSSNDSTTFNVPSAKERIGDFSELLNAATLGGSAIQLYRQTDDGVTAPVAIPNNCMASTSNCGTNAGLTLNATALKVLSLYPTPTDSTKLYNNYTTSIPVVDNTFQWDVRADWTIGAKDTTYSRYSYYNEVGLNTGGSGTVLGPILDGGGFGGGKNKNYGANYMFSETHVFTQTMTNEARFGFNYLHTGFQQPNASGSTATSDTFAAAQGFGGIPGGTLNGGLPNTDFDSTAAPHNFGAPEWGPTDEHENVYQILDNVTKIWGGHSLKAGVAFQNIRFATLQPQVSRGEYDYSSAETSSPGVGNTGYSVASFLLDLQNKWDISNSVVDRDQRWANSVFFQDDWRIKSKLTVNLGLRWEDFQPYKEISGIQANFYVSQKSFNSTTGLGTGAATYTIPASQKSAAGPIITANGFDTALAANNISIVWDADPRLVTHQLTNFAPRVGVAYSPDGKTAIRAGIGMFYGGLESLGYWGNLGENYPFQVNAGYNNTIGCPNNMYCAPDGVTIANGFTAILAKGFDNVVTGLSMRGEDQNTKTPYTESWNLAVERSISNNIVATAAYVGNESHHLQVNVDPDGQLALTNSGNGNSYLTKPMPDYGTAYVANAGFSNYHSLQAKIEKRLSKGYNLLATYTWAHAMDAARTPLGSNGDGDFRSFNLIPLRKDYANSPFDTRQRLTFNALYQLPFGKGRAYLNTSKALDLVAGGWSANAMFTAQTGSYFTIHTSGVSTAGGFENGPYAYQVAGEFNSGGTGANGQTCATSTKNRTHWFNPCSYADPWDAGDATIPSSWPNGGSANSHYIPKSSSDTNTPSGDTTPVYVTNSTMIMGYAGGHRNIALGPGLERVNMSIFKDFTTYREQKLEFRADIFNLFNTVSLGLPSDVSLDSAGGSITSSRSLQSNAPDSRFIQLSLRYEF
ncbi:MAG: carboxypeptidase regulatory-like domain-containing protein [Terracidiphilus sp.]